MRLCTRKCLALGVLGLVLSVAAESLADNPDTGLDDETVCLTRLIAPRGAYFNTGFYPDQNSRVCVTIDVQKNVEYWFGAWNTDWNNQAFALGNDGGGVYVGFGNSGSGTDRAPVPAGLHTMELDAGVYRLDGVVKRTISGYTFKLNYPLYLFAQNRKGTMFQRNEQETIIFHSMQLFDHGTRVKDLRPARRSDGTIGLCDLDNGRAFIAKSGTPNVTWDGIAYTTRESTLCIHDGKLEPSMLNDYVSAEKVGGGQLDACSVTQYAIPLTLAKGTFSVQDGVATARTVDGALTLKGGVHVAFDVTSTGCDSLTATTIQLEDASAENPIVLDGAAVGLTRLVTDGGFPLLGGGLSADDAAKFKLNVDFPAFLEVHEGQLMMMSPPISATTPVVAYWTNARGDGDLTQPANWVCTNLFGEAIAAIPTEATTVHLPSDRVFNCTNNASFTCWELVLPSELAGDSDWRGLGARVNITGTLRLNGHKLFLSSLVGTGTIADSPEYEWLASLRAPKGAFIDTGFTPNNLTRTWMDLTVGGSLENWFGAGGDGSEWWKEKAYSLCNDGSGVYVGWNADSGTYKSAQGLTVLPTGSRYWIELAGGAFRYSAYGSGVTNVWTTRTASTFTCLHTLYLFANHQGKNPDYRFKSGNNVTFHACQIFDNGTLVRDFVPVRRTSDGQVGLIDRAQGDRFYGNVGTSAFVAGNVTNRLDGTGELILDLPAGADIVPSALDVDVPVTGARQWIGGATGDWNDAANWSEDRIPAAGDLVQVRGTVQITGGTSGAWIHNLLARLDAQGGLERLAGVVRPSAKLKVNRVRVGTALTVEPLSFFGNTVSVRVQWSRAATAAKKDYVAVSTEMSWTPQATDYEHWIKCVVSDADGELLTKEFFVSPLPVFYLTTDDGQTPSQNKEKHDGWLFVQGNDEWKSFYDGIVTINVRGNSTAKEPKKPWKLKLDEKAKMFDIPKSKHWTLLANYYDETNLRNKLAYDFANEIGSLGMKSSWVECVLNGEWQGLYLLCEHVRVAKDRVAVYDWENVAEETADALAAAEGFAKEDKKALESAMTDDFRWLDTGTVVYTNKTYDLGASVPNFASITNDISGGYLFQFEYDEWHGEVVWFNVYAPQNASPTFLLPTQFKGAEGMVTSTRVHDWCVDYLQHYGNAVTSVDGYEGGESYAEICDVESLVSYFLVFEMFGNDDGRYRSVFAYKDIGGPLKYGPVWDFDYGVGNYQMTYNPTAWLVNYHRANAFKEWADDPWFCTLLWTRYPAARAAFEEIVKDGGLIDQYYEQLRIPAEVNDAKWRHHYGYYGGIYGKGSHPGLKAFFKTRLAWMDQQFVDVPTLMASLKAGTRTTPSAHPYTPDAQSLPIRFLNAPSGLVPQNEPLKLDVAVGNAQVVKVGVYANAIKVCEQPLTVVNGKISLRVPMSRLTAKVGEPNCISFVAYNASGACVARNFALVWIDWTKQGFQFLIR
ncbi:MAG: CotH kinase family protein [Kiritimatiellae bacterium]|nr:CotH kinase family protein [Kiritimatiellia bacterium]